jgi:acyl-CoA dehydrogenase
LLYAAIEEAAKALAPVPLVPTVTALDVAVAVGAKAVAQRITAGATAAFAVPLHDSGWVMTGADLPEWDGERLSGVVPIVAGAPVAEVLLVLARTTGRDGEVLIAVDPGADGVDVTSHQPLDITATVGALTLTSAAGEVLSDGADLRHALSDARRRALLAVAADSVGVGSRALAMSVEWAGERQQFGRTIGSFQAISHRCTDMLVALEGARSQVLAAAGADVDESEYLVDLAAAAAFDAAVAATEGAMQIHGGIGFTWEHPVHLLLRRAAANAVLVGRADALRDRAAGAVLSR